MTDVFISYAREDQATARLLAAETIRLGYRVWWDDELPAHRNYGDVIAERIEAAKAVIVIWSRHSVASEWVRAEANRGREARKLIQTSTETVVTPIPFDQMHVVSLADWQCEPDHRGWRRVRESLAALAPVNAASPPSPTPSTAPPPGPDVASPAVPPEQTSHLGTPAIIACLVALLLLVAIAIGMLTVPRQPTEPPRRAKQSPATSPAPTAGGRGTDEAGGALEIGDIANSLTVTIGPEGEGADSGQTPALQSFALVNRSGRPVVSINASLPNRNSWGPNMLGDATLASGQSARIQVARGEAQCFWDLRITYDDRSVADLPGTNVCRTGRITLMP